MPFAERIKKKYAYNDYAKWSDEGRWELINGKLYNRTPAPSIKHQNVDVSLWEVFEMEKVKHDENVKNS